MYKFKNIYIYIYLWKKEKIWWISYFLLYIKSNCYREISPVCAYFLIFLTVLVFAVPNNSAHFFFKYILTRITMQFNDLFDITSYINRDNSVFNFRLERILVFVQMFVSGLSVVFVSLFSVPWRTCKVIDVGFYSTIYLIVIVTLASFGKLSANPVWVQFSPVCIILF